MSRFMARWHEPHYRNLTPVRYVTVTCKCGWCREHVTRRQAREMYDRHIALHAPRDGFGGHDLNRDRAR